MKINLSSSLGQAHRIAGTWRPGCPAWWKVFLQGLIVAVGWVLNLSPVSAAEVVIPPFVVEGRLLTQEFRIEGTNLNYRTDASFVFLYSNGWWQVEARHANQKLGFANVLNCMKIPDGTRTYTLFEGNTNLGMTMAMACPTAFPPPGRSELLVPWLSFCPQPKLPVIDGNRMRRFINLPFCRPDVFDTPQNEGFFETKQLAPGNAFLSELVVTNNGYSVEPTVVANGSFDAEIMRYSAPFENGFTEFHYQVLTATNYNGVAFPLRTVCKRLRPNWEKKDRNDLHVWLQSELTVTRITFSEADVARRIVGPEDLFAEDYRPPNLPKAASASYLVDNDQWKPVSDPEITRRARMVRNNSDPYLKETD